MRENKMVGQERMTSLAVIYNCDSNKISMQSFQAPQSKIHVITRAILIQEEQIVLCRAKGREKFFLPGGHVENGETVKQALLRELEEELGSHEYRLGAFAGVCEGIFPTEKGIFQQEVNLLFEVHIPKGKILSKESHIEFICIDKTALGKYDVMPLGIKEGMIEWMSNEVPFFREFQK